MFATFGGMANKKPSPLQASFWLSEQEKRYILVICAIFLIGIVARYFHLKFENTDAYTPPGLEKTENTNE